VVGSVGGSGSDVCDVSAAGVSANTGVTDGNGGYSLSLSSKVGGIIDL